MAQGAQLIELYGWVDDLLERRRADLDVAAFWVPQYRAGLEPGWYADFRAAVGVPGNNAFVEIDSALDTLSRLDPNEPRRQGRDDELRRLDGRSVARRLYALTYLAQVLPDEYGVDGSRAGLVRALLEQIVTYDRDELPDEPANLASQLHATLSDPSISGERITESAPQEAFSHIVESSVEDGVLAVSFTDNADVVCDDAPVLQETRDGKSVEATLLTTEFCIDGKQVSDFGDLLDPSRWPVCFSHFWCSMEPVPAPVGVPGEADPEELGEYVETVGECGEPQGWTISTCLKFARRTLSDGTAILSFRLCEQQEATNRVLIDSGYISVRPTATGVCIRTAKAIAIEGVPGEGVHIAACVSDWAQGAKDVAFACSQAPLEEHLDGLEEAPRSDLPEGRIVVPVRGRRWLLDTLGPRTGEINHGGR